MKQLLLTFLALTFIWSCDEDPQKKIQEQLEADIAEIEVYLAENNITAIKDPTGVFYVIDSLGVGDYPTSTSTVTMAYEGRFFNGTVFDSADPVNPLKTSLSSLITGWRIGIPKFKKSGYGTLYIPSGFAYGPNGAGNSIPGNENLIFDVHLLDFD